MTSAINPLYIQSPSSLFSLIIQLCKFEDFRSSGGAVIGIGNDIDLWWLMSYITDISIFESNEQWMHSVEDHLNNIPFSLRESSINLSDCHSGRRNSSDSQISLTHFHNQIGISAYEQLNILKKCFTSSSFKADLIDKIKSTKLFKELQAKNLSWIYVDGPAGGYEKGKNLKPAKKYKQEADTGRMETILASVLALNDSSAERKYLIIDDSFRQLEELSVLLSSEVVDFTKRGYIGHKTLVLKVI